MSATLRITGIVVVLAGLAWLGWAPVRSMYLDDRVDIEQRRVVLVAEVDRTRALVARELLAAIVVRYSDHGNIRDRGVFEDSLDLSGVFEPLGRHLVSAGMHHGGCRTLLMRSSI